MEGTADTNEYLDAMHEMRGAIRDLKGKEPDLRWTTTPMRKEPESHE